MINTVVRNGSDLVLTLTLDEQNQSEDNSQKKKNHHKKEGEETYSTVNSKIQYNIIESI